VLWALAFHDPRIGMAGPGAPAPRVSCEAVDGAAEIPFSEEEIADIRVTHDPPRDRTGLADSRRRKPQCWNSTPTVSRIGIMLRRLHYIALIATVTLLPLAAHATQSYKPLYVWHPAQICVERPENEGIVNIVPVTVVIAPGSKITLTGGQAGCLFLLGGRESIRLSFPYPYGGRQAPRFWTTPPTTILARSGTTVSFELCEAADQDVDDPQWAKTGWHKMWVLQRPKRRGNVVADVSPCSVP
jgi:hypothetical protein